MRIWCWRKRLFEWEKMRFYLGQGYFHCPYLSFSSLFLFLIFFALRISFRLLCCCQVFIIQAQQTDTMADSPWINIFSGMFRRIDAWACKCKGMSLVHWFHHSYSYVRQRRVQMYALFVLGVIFGLEKRILDRKQHEHDKEHIIVSYTFEMPLSFFWEFDSLSMSFPN